MVFFPLYRHECWFRWISVNFKLLTCSTSLDVVLDKDSKSWPPIMFLDRIKCLKLSRMSHCWMIVVSLDNFPMEFCINWHIVLSFVEQYVFSFKFFHFPVHQILLRLSGSLFKQFLYCFSSIIIHVFSVCYLLL
jgi:hypothetical protein